MRRHSLVAAAFCIFLALSVAGARGEEGAEESTSWDIFQILWTHCEEFKNYGGKGEDVLSCNEEVIESPLLQLPPQGEAAAPVDLTPIEQSLEALTGQLTVEGRETRQLINERLPQTVLPHAEVASDLSVFLGQNWWLLVVLGALLLLLLVLGLATWRFYAQNMVLQRRYSLLGRNYIWDEVPYEFEGKAYQIKLVEITREGRWYKTPFLDRVKEEDLVSHFTQETKKPLRAA